MSTNNHMTITVFSTVIYFCCENGRAGKTQYRGVTSQDIIRELLLKYKPTSYKVWVR